jgi:hypothetical protein
MKEFLTNKIQLTAAIVTLLVFIGIGPINVFEEGDREIDSSFIQKLNVALNSYDGDTIRVMAIHGDNEAFNFAKEVAIELQNNGYSIESLDTLISARPVSSFQYQINENNTLEIIIGKKET